MKMTKLIKIPKKHYMSDRGVPMFICDDWLTNGKFAIRKEFIDGEQVAIFKHHIDIEGIRMPDMGHVMPDMSSVSPLAISGILIESDDYTQRLCVVSGERLYIDDSIFKLLKPAFTKGVNTVGTDGKSPVIFARDGEPMAMIMPMIAKHSNNVLDSFLNNTHKES